MLVCKPLGNTPNELFQDRKQEVKKEGIEERHRIEMKVKGFLRFLEKEKSVDSSGMAYFRTI